MTSLYWNPEYGVKEKDIEDIKKFLKEGGSLEYQIFGIPLEFWIKRFNIDVQPTES